MAVSVEAETSVECVERDEPLIGLLKCFVALITKLVRSLILRSLIRSISIVSRSISSMQFQTSDTRLSRNMCTRDEQRLNIANRTLSILDDFDLSNVQQLHQSNVLLIRSVVVRFDDIFPGGDGTAVQFAFDKIGLIIDARDDQSLGIDVDH